MASPQLEHGYSRIANEILEALARSDLNGRQRRVLDIIFRESYGRGRRDAELSYRELAQRTGIDRRNVIAVIKQLTVELVLNLSGRGGGVKNDTTNKNKFIFQKDYHRWGGVKNKASVKNDTSTSVKNDTSPYIDFKKEKESPPQPLGNSPPQNGKTPAFMELIGNDRPSQLHDLTPPKLKPWQLKTKSVPSLPEPLRKLLMVYKRLQKFRMDDAKWDQVYFKRFANTASDLLDVFDGDYKVAAMCLAELGGKFDDKGLDWTLNTIVNHAGEWKSKHATSEPARNS